MHNLLSAGFKRLWTNKGFWLGIVTIFAFSVFYVLNGIRQSVVFEHSTALDNFYFKLAPMLGLFCAIFISFFIGTEHSEGTLRNKIIVGRTRTQVYLSNYIISLVAGTCFILAWLIGGLTGIPAFGFWRFGVNGLLLYALIAFLFIAAFTGILTLLSMLSSNKSITIVTAILLVLGLLMFASMVYNRLGEPEFYSGVVITSDGMQMGDPTPNPNYITGAKRDVYQFILDVLPTGQSIMMANLELTHFLTSIIASLCISITTVTVGVFAFNKKDLK